MLFASNKKKVLVIDDDPSLRRQLIFRLQTHENMDVIEAGSGESGLMNAEDHDPDLIILDWMLPDIQGPVVLDLLRHKHKTKFTPVLMLTGRNKFGDIEDAFGLGADAYLTKPFSLQKLGEKVRELLTPNNP